ncbi:hypothetical protein TNCV_4285771 [Trichonephila clavipes]|nr:hypothetical protein TNCV_4285771 [Trichonephila clavipes]
MQFYFTVSNIQQLAGAAVCEYFGHPAFSEKVIRTSQFQILIPQSESPMRLTLDAPVWASSVTRGNEIRKRDSNIKPFHLILTIYGKVSGVSEI